MENMLGNTLGTWATHWEPIENIAGEHEMAVGFSIEHGIAVGLADGMHRKWSSWSYFCLFFTRFAFSFPSRCCRCCCYGCIVAEFLVPWFKITVAVKVRVVVFPEAFSFAIAAASF
jgi:hypothetical protein